MEVTDNYVVFTPVSGAPFSVGLAQAAAAPELLELLREAFQHIASRGGSVSNKTAHMQARIRAAIAKAEGES